MQVKPILLVTDIPCMVAPIAERDCAGLLENGGALPRLPPTRALEIGRVSIPDLRQLLSSAESVRLQQPQAMPEAEQLTIPPDVYALYRCYSPSNRIQAYVDFRELFASSAVAEINHPPTLGDRNAHLAPVAVNWAFEVLGSLHERGMRAICLMEVVLVMRHWCKVMVHRLRHVQSADRMFGGANGVSRTGTEEDFQRTASFLEHVLAVAAGSTNGRAPPGPDFINSIFESRSGDVRAFPDAVFEFHTVSTRGFQNYGKRIAWTPKDSP